MKILLKLFAVGLLSVAFSSAQATVIDFEDQAPIPHPNLTIGEVSFQGYTVWEPIPAPLLGEMIGGLAPPVAPYEEALVFIGNNPVMGQHLTGDPGQLSNALAISFLNPVLDMGFDYAGLQNEWEVFSFDAAWNPLFGDFIGPVDGVGHFNLLPGPSVSHVVLMSFSPPVPGMGIEIDNLTFTSAVPEPSVYALMLGGLGLVGFVARRRRTVA